MSEPTLDRALELAENGYPVFPLNGKVPAVKGGRGFHDASTDAVQIRIWWNDYPDAAVGIPTGPASGLVVIDADLYKSEFDVAAWADLAERLPMGAPEQKTPSGGLHVFLAYPTGSTVSSANDALGRCIDRKATGGYVVDYGVPLNGIPLPEGPSDVYDAPKRRAEQNGKATSRHGAALAALSCARSPDSIAAVLSGPEAAELVKSRGAGIGLRELSRMIRPEASTGDIQAATHGDVANSRRFAAANDGKLIHVVGLGWYAWDGSRWKPDERAPYQCAKRIADALWLESLCVDPLERKQHVKYAVQAQRCERLRAMITLASNEPALAKDPADLDRHAGRLNVANGTIDLESGRLLPHDPLDYHSKIVPIAYDPEADCQLWESFLERIFAGDDDLISYLHRAIGYSLTASLAEQVWFFGYGIGANGKSTLFRILLDLLGEYGLQAPPELLLQKHGETHPTEVAALLGARVAVCTEVEAGRKLDEVRVKALTGGDLVTARKMRQDFFTFEPTAKLWVAGNHKPQVRGTDHATWRRIRLIPFNVTIPDFEQDRDLLSKLRDELPGILAWSVAGARLWHARGLGTARAIKEATDEYRDDEDTLADFLAECCVARPDLPATPAASLYGAYTTWADAAGIKRPMSQKKLGGVLTERGFRRQRDSRTRRWAWKGLALHPDRENRDWKDGDFR